MMLSRCHRRVLWVALLLLLPLAAGTTNKDEDDDGSPLDDLNLDDIDEESPGDVELTSSNGDRITQSAGPVISANTPVKDQFELMKRAVRVALRRPGAYAHLAQVLPILRVMTGPQRLAFASFVLRQIGTSPNQNDESALKMAYQLAGDAAPSNSTNEMVPKLLLPLSADIANLFRGVALEMNGGRGPESKETEQQGSHHGEARARGGSQVLPLWRGQVPDWRQRPHQPPRRVYPAYPQPGGLGVNRRNAHITDMVPPPPPPPQGTLPKGSVPLPMQTFTSPPQPPVAPRTPKPKPVQNSCELFSEGLCLTVQHYPEEAIRQSIREDHLAAQALATDPAAFNSILDADGHINRRKDEMGEAVSDPKDAEGLPLCSSTVRYARPQRARATSGQWKYIVNTAEHSQTLRLEKCSRPNDSCSYISEKYSSKCSQVYNYHRLLTWDKEKGLHLDIFKVPSCCSCRVYPNKQNAASIFLNPTPTAGQSLTSEGPSAQSSSSYSVHEPSEVLQPQFETSALHESVGSNSVHQRDQPGEEHDDPYHYMGANRASWPFRKPATLRPPNLHLDELGEDPTAEDLVPPPTFPALTDLRRITVPYGSRDPNRGAPSRPNFHLPSGRAPVRNRTKPDTNELPDLTAEGSQRRPYPLILTPDGASSHPAFATLRTPTSTTPAPGSSSPPTTQAPRRVNYSYHPIIEFFRPEQRVPVQQPRLAGRSSSSGGIPGAPVAAAPVAAAWANDNDWSPITSGPLGVTTSHVSH